MSKVMKMLPLAAFLMRRRKDEEDGQEPRRSRRAAKLLALAGAGAAAEYFLDPEQGRRRRAGLRDRMAGTARRKSTELERKTRYAQGRAEGAMARLSGAGTPSPADDRAVTDLIRQALAGLDCQTTQVVVDVFNGSATLRGQVPHPADVHTVEEAVARVPGVRSVESFLHLPKTPAPNKAEAIAASRLPGAPQVVHHG